MDNTIQNEIDSNRTALEFVKSLIKTEINREVSMIGYCDKDLIEKLDDIPNWSANRDRLITIYNLAKCREVMGDNHSAMIRELRKKAEEESEEESE